ncbi:MAG: 4,5-DOPA dioxygenase extradiol, partial [Bacteroidota bacterium]
ALRRETENLPKTTKMPVLFIGHGSPMNGIENNLYTRGWKEATKNIPTPRAVVCISAHWLTKGTFVTAMEKPRTIHDFGGFPPELYQVQYPAPGSPNIASEIAEKGIFAQITPDHEWGLDHGTWTVVRHLFPEANIPVLQVSIDYHQSGEFHYRLAQDLAALRHKGILFIGSGNMVHNLRMVDFSRLNEPGFGFDWAAEMNEVFKEKIGLGDHKSLMNYHNLNKAAVLAIPTPDHYWPLIYSLGLTEHGEIPFFFNDVLVGGSLTMTSVRIG